MSNYVCPKCGSDQIQLYSIAYSGGISAVNTNTVGVGLTGSGIGVGGAKTVGTSQTALSQSVAPPEKLPVVKGILMSVILVPLVVAIVVGILEIMLKIRLGAVASVIIFAAMVYALYRYPYNYYQYNKNVYPQEMERWQHSWLCAKCGHRFIL